jgi:hypothetical protein
MKKYWIVAPMAVAAALLYGLQRGIWDGVLFYIPDMNGPLPHHPIMMCRYLYFSGVHTLSPLPPRPSFASQPNLPSVGECPFLASEAQVETPLNNGLRRVP